MVQKDEDIRNAVTDELTRASVDARNLAIEVKEGRIFVAGTVGSDDSLQRLLAVLKGHGDARIVTCDVKVLPTVPSDSVDGRGRSPVTGTSADSAHESRHQLDKS
ncbi:MAG TPA: hypothetical protein VJQ81_02490 [Reyranella sp.]|jgi:hypothetical protein|nr:hypothetical protein [Reyranella sp.]